MVSETVWPVVSIGRVLRAPFFLESLRPYENITTGSPQRSRTGDRSPFTRAGKRVVRHAAAKSGQLLVGLTRQRAPSRRPARAL
jgi:hypothetical protein